MKLKTKRAAAKRIKITASGLIKTRKANKSHLLSGKSRKRKRFLKKTRIVKGGIAKNIKIMLGGLN